jgi:hypothetical protein
MVGRQRRYGAGAQGKKHEVSYTSAMMTRRRGHTPNCWLRLPPAMGHKERNTRLVIQARWWREEEDAQLLAASSTSDAPPRLCGNLHDHLCGATAPPARTHARATKTDTTVVVSYPPALGNPLALRTSGTWDMMMRTLITRKHIIKLLILNLANILQFRKGDFLFLFLFLFFSSFCFRLSGSRGSVGI